MQLDQVLDVFSAPTRDALVSGIHEFGEGLAGEPQSGAHGLRDSSRALSQSLRSFARVTAAWYSSAYELTMASTDEPPYRPHFVR